jgi:hypothetical protein
MRYRYFLTLLLTLILLAACTATPPAAEPPTAIPEPSQTPTLIPSPSSTPTEAPPEPLTLEETAERVITALAEKDLVTVAEFAHPEMGVRFSPYTYVREDHLVFTPEELTGLVGSDQVHKWGHYDGTGDPIELTFDEYFQEFVYSADFANPEEMAIDEELGWGNTINNITEFYPGSSFVEYHFSGFEEQYQGMDWESLRLVFIQEEGTWYLVGIVHDQWTI